jgi:2-iminobutanoate/2-iminopropanoate deaminase
MFYVVFAFLRDLFSSRKVVMQPVSTSRAAAPAGHYSQAMVHGGVVYVSAQLPRTADGADAADAEVETQAERALSNIREILIAAGTDTNHLLQVTVLLSDISLWGRVNAVYERFMGEHRPARAVIPTGPLHLGYAVGFQAIAALPD